MKRALKAVGNPWGQRITLFVIICVVMAVAQPLFLRPANAMSIILAISVTGIMACGMLFTIIVGGIDFSVASMAGISAAISFSVAQSYGFSDAGFLYGCALALGLCLVVGWVNGFITTTFGIPAFVVTLAMKNLLYGCIYFVLRGFYVYIPQVGLVFHFGSANILGVPMPVIVFVILLIICAFVLGKTTYGRRLYVIGGNKNVATLAGVSTKLAVRSAYMISSVLAGIGGILLASMNGQAGMPTAVGYEGNVLMAMVVGGINLAGGEGGIPGTVFGALFVGIINNIMLLLSVSSDYQKLVQGAIILAAMILNVFAKRGTTRAIIIRRKPKMEKV